MSALLKRLTALGLLVAVGSAGAAGQPSLHRVVFATVLDAQDNVVSGLGATSFNGEFHGRPVTVVSSTEDTAPRHVAIVVDASASEQTAVRRLWSEAERLIDHLVPQNAVAVFTLGPTLKRFSDFTADRDALAQTVRAGLAQAPAGRTSLYDGLAEVAAAMPDGPGNAICVFSDGDDTSSRRSPIDVARLLAAKRLRLFLMGDVESVRLYGSVKGPWSAIADATGGRTVWINSATQDSDQVLRSISGLAATIANGYRIELDLGTPLDKERDWALRVIDSRGHALKTFDCCIPTCSCLGRHPS